jgi:DNA helicase IV
MNLPNISDEQKNIIEKLENNNVIVDSVAGSGKTTFV